MEELLTLLRARLSAGEDLALATVAARSGSAPRGAGARMVVNASGRLWGTVGGGAIEHQAQLLALEALNEKRGVLREFCLDAQGAQSIGMVCGGDVTLLVQYLPAGSAPALDPGPGGWLVCTLDGDGRCGLELLSAHAAQDRGLTGTEPVFTRDGPAVRFAQRLSPDGTVFVFGGGHVARELSPLLARLDFRHMVLDDRPQFAQAADFPGAERVIRTDFARILDVISPAQADYAVVMTHGHTFDLEVQKRLLTTPVGYIGVMGSRKKRAFVFDRLRQAGFTDADLARIVTPVGLPLGGETPAEIALSIAAQLVQLRAGKGG